MEVEYFEGEYLKIIEKLKGIATAEEGGVSEQDDFESGVSMGREGLAKELIIQMQSVVIEVHYGEM